MAKREPIFMSSDFMIDGPPPPPPGWEEDYELGSRAKTDEKAVEAFRIAANFFGQVANHLPNPAFRRELSALVSKFEKA
jgi:hypothetical protein